MRRWVAAAVIVLVATAAACGDSGEARGRCEAPPASEIEAPSSIAMTLNPNPVTAGTRAILEVSDAGLASGAFVGLGLAWQCWDGFQWIDTYQLVRAVDPFQAQAIVVEPGVTTTIAALGVPIPSIAEILIPNVPPGIYRIWDEAGSTPGHLIVEVANG
jgi:hypothetical protein